MRSNPGNAAPGSPGRSPGDSGTGVTAAAGVVRAGAVWPAASGASCGCGPAVGAFVRDSTSLVKARKARAGTADSSQPVGLGLAWAPWAAREQGGRRDQDGHGVGDRAAVPSAAADLQPGRGGSELGDDSVRPAEPAAGPGGCVADGPVVDVGERGGSGDAAWAMSASAARRSAASRSTAISSAAASASARNRSASAARGARQRQSWPRLPKHAAQRQPYAASTSASGAVGRSACQPRRATGRRSPPPGQLRSAATAAPERVAGSRPGWWPGLGRHGWWWEEG